MNNKRFFVGLVVVVGCASWLAGCTTDEEESSDGSSGWAPDTRQEEGDDGGDEQRAEPNEASPLKAKPFPHCGTLPCPYGTQCAFDAWGEPSCMAPPGTTCSTMDCGEYFHCKMTTAGAVCTVGGSTS